MFEKQHLKKISSLLRLSIVLRKGEGVFKIFKCLGERAQVYRDKLGELAGRG